MANKLQVAVVGCGYWGKNHVRNFYQLGYLAGVCDVDCEATKKITQDYVVPIYTWQEILSHKDIQAVIIVTPAQYHKQMAIEALTQGKHVFIEKPMALSLVDAQLIELKAKAMNRILMIGHILRYHPAYCALSELLTHSPDKMGELIYIYSCRFNKLILNDRRLNGLNVLWEFTPHDLSMLIGLVGNDLIDYDIQELNLGMKSINLLYRGGLKVDIDISWNYTHKEQKLIVSGTKGFIVFDDCQPWDKKLQLYPANPHWTKNDSLPDLSEVTYLQVDTYEPLRHQCNHFIESIKSHQEPVTNGEEGVHVIDLLEKISKKLIEKNKESQGLMHE